MSLSLFPEAQQRPPARRSPKPDSKNGFVSSLWSFDEANEPLPYRWYGTLPTALVRRLLELFSKEGDRVLDAFCGSGSVVRVAAEMNRPAIGLDVNPLACLMARARLDAGMSHDDAKPLVAGINTDAMSARLDQSWSICRQARQELRSDRYAYTRKWFNDDTLFATYWLLNRIASVDDAAAQRGFFLSAAQVIRDVANVDSRCTHHLVTKKKPFIDPVDAWVKQAPVVLESLSKPKVARRLASIRQESALATRLKSASFDLLVAHPPYLGVIHYHLIHRLATDLMELVQEQRKPESLADLAFSNAEIKDSDVSTDSEDRYRVFVERFAKQASRLTAPGGRCVVIIGDQRHKGLLRHPFTDFITELKANGFAVEELFVWTLQNNGGMHVLRRGHFIDHNYIVVFRNLEE